MEGQSSTSLTDLGRQQARQLARLIVPTAPNRPLMGWPTHLYSSPLLRAQQTAQPLIDALQSLDHQFQTIVDSRLQEIHQGIFQGLTWSEAQAQFPDLCAHLMSSLEWHPVPGAESPTAASTRSHHWLQHILSAHSPGDTVWAVSHAGIMLHLITEIMGCVSEASPKENRLWQTEIDHTATFEFWLSQLDLNHPLKASQPDAFSPKRWILKRFNQVVSDPLAVPAQTNCLAE